MSFSSPISLAIIFAVLSLVPLAVVISTAFLKISTVILLIRNALGVQQIPPNIAVYALSFVLTLYILAPVIHEASAAVKLGDKNLSEVTVIADVLARGAEPMRVFLRKHSKAQQRQFFIQETRRLWPPNLANTVSEDDFLILLPAFVVGELTEAFEIGFLLYLPFVVIDLIVSNILLSLGMMMVSPSTISLPLKLFLFITVDGWTRLLHGLILSYA